MRPTGSNFPNLIARLANACFGRFVARGLPLLPLLLVITGAENLRAATLTVNSTADDATVNGNCTLREAVQAANTNLAVDGCAAGSGADTILFSTAIAGQTINLNIAGDAVFGPTALLISSPVTIQGSATRGMMLSRNPLGPSMRIFRVASGASLALQSVTVSGGLARGFDGGGAGDGKGGGSAGLGGAVFNEGTLTLTQCTFSGNNATGGNGGGAVANGGGAGGAGLNEAGQPGATGFDGGRGGGPNYGSGGLWNGGSGPGDGGAGGVGGGGGGGALRGGTGGHGGPGGFGGGGGGGTGSNGTGVGGNGGAGGIGGGGGGGSHNSGTAPGNGGAGGFGGGTGATGNSYPGGGGGGGGLGGAIFNRAGTVTVRNSTLSGNSAIGGNGGAGYYCCGGPGPTGNGGHGFGAAIFNLDGSVTAQGATLAANTVTGGTGTVAGSAAGGGIYSQQTTGSAGVTLQDSIFADSAGGTDAVIGSGSQAGSGNIIEANSGVNAGLVLSSLDPMLQGLANYGDATATQPFSAAASPAYNAGTCAGGTLAADQRGTARPQGAACDIGAVEAYATAHLKISKSSAYDSALDRMTWTLSATNEGLVTANATLTDVFPAQVAPPVCTAVKLLNGVSTTLTPGNLATGAAHTLEPFAAVVYTCRANFGVTLSLTPSYQKILTGQTANFSLTVSNPSGIAQSFTVTSSTVPGCNSSPNLAAGGSQTWGCSRTNVVANFTNTVTVSAAPVTINNSASVSAPEDAGSPRVSATSDIITPSEVSSANVYIHLGDQIVNTTADELNSDGDCSLREAIQAANTDTAVDQCKPGLLTDTIRFAPALNGQTLSLSTSGDATRGPSALAISTAVIIHADPGQNITLARDAATPRLRLFLVTAAGSLTLENLTVSGGVARGGTGGGGGNSGGGGAGLGGAIYNLGALSLYRTTLSGNQAIGGNSGASYNTCCGSNLQGGGGGGGLGADGAANGGDAGGAGGGPNGGSSGPYNGNGGAGGLGGGGGGAGGTNGSTTNNGGNGGFGGGGGAAGYNTNRGNSGTFGGGGGGSSSVGGNADIFGGAGGYRGSSGFATGGGGAGLGGAIFNDNATLTVTESTLSGNGTVGGSAGNPGSYGGSSGLPGNGAMAAGALFNYGGTVTVSGSTFSGNTALGGNGGSSQPGYGGGSAGHARGAAIFGQTGAVTVSNSTFYQNSATGGNGGSCASGYTVGNGGWGQGGALFVRDGSLTMIHSTVSGNTSTAGVKGSGGSGGSNGGAEAGGLYVWQDAGSAGVSLTDNIFANAAGGVDVQVTGATALGSLNLIRSNTGVPAGLISGTADPKLGTLSNNGGATLTLGFAPSSPARDTGDCAGGSVTVDQRGTARPIGAACDLGAFEFDPVTAPAPIAVNDTAIAFQMSDNFETGNFSNNPWTFSGNAPWTVSTLSVHGGTYAARSGVITHSQNTVMQLVKLVPAGTLSFWARVSSESGYDFLRFYVDGAQQLAISGNGVWNAYSYPIAAGNHTFAWRYDKDSTASANLDTAFVDDILYTPTVPQTLNEDAIFPQSAPGVLFNDSDPLGDAITVDAAAISSTGGAAVTLSADGGYSYDPRSAPLIQATQVGQTYNDSFTYTIRNTSNKTASATVSLAIAGINDLPVAVTNGYSTNRDTALNVSVPALGLLGNDSDADGDSLTAVKDTDPLHGVLALNADGTFTFTPTAGYTGPDSFTYHANDGTANSSVATVSLTVLSTTPGRVPDSGVGHLVLGKNSGTPGTLNLSWGASCSAVASDFAVYQGTLGVWYSHTSALCSTGGTTGVTALNPAAGSTYYLIAPRSAAAEGSYGLDGAGAEIPRPGVTCLGAQINPGAGCS